MGYVYIVRCVFRNRVEEVCIYAQAAIECVGTTQGEFPLRGLLIIWIDQYEEAVVSRIGCGVGDLVDHLLRDIVARSASAAEFPVAEDRASAVEVTILQLHVREAIVAPSVRNPYVWVTARVETSATANRQVVVSFPGKAQTRHEQVEAVDVGIITQTAISRSECRVVVGAVVTFEPIVT